MFIAVSVLKMVVGINIETYASTLAIVAIATASKADIEIADAP